MPSYDVKCTTCGCEYEQWHKMSESHTPCKVCESQVVTNLTSNPPPVHFKGRGWSTADFYTSGMTNRNGTMGKDQLRAKEEIVNE